MTSFDYNNPPDTIGSIPEKVIAALGIKTANCEVTLPKYIIHKHIKRRHEVDFDSWEAFVKHVSAMPEILSSPECVGFHPDGNSIRFVKRIDEITVLALGLCACGDSYEVKTLFPISQSKYDLWLLSGEMTPIAP